MNLMQKKTLENDMVTDRAPRKNEILSNIEHAILNGTRSFESDTSDDKAF